jgi:hypothetical protein
MPYIKSGDGRREALQRGEPALIAGELNYQIFYYVKHIPVSMPLEVIKIKIKEFVDRFLGKKPNYQKYNDITGCLIRCQREIERRISGKYNIECAILELMNSYDEEIAKYEDLKELENGDVE